MLYKELHQATRKFFPILLGYILVGLLFSTLLSPSRTASNNSIFHNWIIATLFLTMGAAILGGSDIIAEETGKNTLSFLLTRPVSRTNIYAIKFLVSATFLSVILLGTSLVMFLVEQLPQRYQSGWTPPGGDTVYKFVYPDKMPAGEAFTCIAVILGIGLAVLALTTLISIFSRSALHAIVTTILIAFGLIAFYAFSDLFLQISYRVNRVFDIYNGLGFWDFFVLLDLAAVLYITGLKIFKAKEF